MEGVCAPAWNAPVFSEMGLWEYRVTSNLIWAIIIGASLPVPLAEPRLPEPAPDSSRAHSQTDEIEA